MRNFIDPPISGVQKPVFFAEHLKLIDWTVGAIPPGIHPEIFKPDIFFGDLFDEMQTRGRLHSAPSQVRDRQNYRLPVILGRVVFQNVPPQNVMGIEIVPYPREEQDLRSANLLTGMQRKVRAFHVGAHRNRRLSGTREVDGPFARPAQSSDQAPPRCRNVEKRYGLNGLASAFTRNLKGFELIQWLFYQ